MITKKTTRQDRHARPVSFVTPADTTAVPDQPKDDFRQISTETILESISYGVFTIDMDWRITSFNKTAEELTGINRLNAIGRRCTDIFRSNMCGKDCAIKQTLATHTPIIDRTVFIRNTEERQIPVSVSTSVLHNNQNEVIGAAQIFRNLQYSVKLTGKETRQIHVSELITRNKNMGRIIRILPQIAASECPVLIEGENGTGKELLARLIHTLSCRNNKPFISIDCGALAQHLLETELFGSDPEILTCSCKVRPCCFERAEGSTLHLNGINTLSLPVQARLLQILHEKTCEPYCNASPMRTDIRMISSSTRRVSSLINEGTFLQNLYYRINIIKLTLPPLRNRKEDLPMLIDHFISQCNLSQNKSVKGVSHETMDLLMRYDFPDNISELKNIIENAFLLCSEDHIIPANISVKPRKSTFVKSQPLAMGMAVQAVEAQAIIAALKRNNYNRKAAAHELGIHKSTFFRKIKHLGISLPQVNDRFQNS